MNSDADDPWAGDVPSAPPPASFEFPERRPAARPATHSGETGSIPHRERPSRDEHPDAFGRSTDDANPPTNRRNAALAAGAVFVIVLLVVGLLRRGDDDDTSTATPVDTGRDVPSSPSVGEVTDTTGTPDTAVAPAPSTTRPTSAVPLPTVTEPPPSWQDGGITALPDAVAAISPAAEVVASTAGGKIIRIDTSSGRTTTIDLNRRTPESDVHFISTSILISGSSRPPTLVPETGPPIEIDLPANRGLYVDGPVPGGLLVTTWSPAEQEERVLVIRPDGTTERVEDPVPYWRSGSVGDDGRRWIIDAGGLYLESADGTTRRFSTGERIASNGAMFLVRECDEQRRCLYVVIDVDSGERRTAVLTDELFFTGNVGDTSLSPDGASLVVTFWDDTPTELIDLGTGATRRLDLDLVGPDGRDDVVWAADSSGFFVVESGELVFFDRTGIDSWGIGFDFDDNDVVQDVAVRRLVEV